MARITKKPAPKKSASTPTLARKKTSQLSGARTGSSAATSLLSKDLNDFLHQDKDSKKAKRSTKKSAFLSKIGVSPDGSTDKSSAPIGSDSYKYTTATENNPVPLVRTTIHDLPPVRVSKSAAKRQRRAAKSAVLNSVVDLDSALPSFDTNTSGKDSTRQGYTASTRNVATNRPPTAKMTERVVKHEMAKFSQTLNQKEFKSSPFAALKASIMGSTFVSKPQEPAAEKMEL